MLWEIEDHGISFFVVLKKLNILWLTRENLFWKTKDLYAVVGRKKIIHFTVPQSVFPYISDAMSISALNFVHLL
jgi:hypothetical protein